MMGAWRFEAPTAQKYLQSTSQQQDGTKATWHINDSSNLGAVHVFFWARFSSGASLGLGIYPLDGWGNARSGLLWLGKLLLSCRSLQGLNRAVWMTGSSHSFNLQLHRITHFKPLLHLIAYFASAFSFFSLAFPASPTHCKHCNKFQNKTRFWSQTSKRLGAWSLNCLDVKERPPHRETSSKIPSN